jgi:hypothetical protein
MSDLPEIEETDELAEARRGLAELRTALFVNGLDLVDFRQLVEAVRLLDAEIVAAIHRHRISELYPYFPESFQPEEDGYEAAEKWLRAELPMEWDL